MVNRGQHSILDILGAALHLIPVVCEGSWILNPVLRLGPFLKHFWWWKVNHLAAYLFGGLSKLASLSVLTQLLSGNAFSCSLICQFFGDRHPVQPQVWQAHSLGPVFWDFFWRPLRPDKESMLTLICYEFTMVARNLPWFQTLPSQSKDISL